MKVEFFLTASGRSPVEEFLKDLSEDLKSKFWDAVLLLEEGQNLPMPLSRNLSSIERGLNELRLRDPSGIFRFFYFIKKGDAIFFLHAFKKKTQEIPLKYIEVIRKRIREI